LRAASGRGFRYSIFFRELAEERIRARQMMWDGSFRPFHFDDGVARIRGDLLPRIDDPVGGANERLSQINRIRNDADQGEIVPMPDPVFDQRRAVAPGN